MFRWMLTSTPITCVIWWIIHPSDVLCGPMGNNIIYEAGNHQMESVAVRKRKRHSSFFSLFCCSFQVDEICCYNWTSFFGQWKYEWTEAVAKNKDLAGVKIAAILGTKILAAFIFRKECPCFSGEYYTMHNNILVLFVLFLLFPVWARVRPLLL